MSESKTYSFRAECALDVSALQAECERAKLSTFAHITPDKLLPDVEVELETDTNLEHLRSLMRKVQDGHVMVQTLRECPLKENSLERDSSIT